MDKKATDEYIERFMSIIDDEDREQYKGIEVKVITEGEHVLDAGYYVVGGNAIVSIPDPGFNTNVLVVDHGKLVTSGYNGYPCVFVEDHGFVNISFGGRVHAKGESRVNASCGVLVWTSEKAAS